MYYVYFLKSLKQERFYIGCTSDVQERLRQHNAGYTKSTKPYRPWMVLYSEQFPTKTEAMKREWFLKHPPGYLEKKAIMEQNSSVGGFA